MLMSIVRYLRRIWEVVTRRSKQAGKSKPELNGSRPPLKVLEALAAEDAKERALGIVRLAAVASQYARQVDGELSEREQRRLDALVECARRAALEAKLAVDAWACAIVEAVAAADSSDQLAVAGLLLSADLLVSTPSDDDDQDEEGHRDRAHKPPPVGSLGRLAVRMVSAEQLGELLAARRSLLHWEPWVQLAREVLWLAWLSFLDDEPDERQEPLELFDERMERRQREHGGRPLPPYVPLGRA